MFLLEKYIKLNFLLNFFFSIQKQFQKSPQYQTLPSLFKESLPFVNYPIEFYLRYK